MPEVALFFVAEAFAIGDQEVEFRHDIFLSVIMLVAGLTGVRWFASQEDKEKALRSGLESGIMKPAQTARAE